MNDHGKENLLRVVFGTIAGAAVGLVLGGFTGAGVGAAAGLLFGAFAAD